VILISSSWAAGVILEDFPSKVFFSSWVAERYSFWNCMYSESMPFILSIVLEREDESAGQIGP